MRRCINPLLLLAAHARRSDLIRQIQYLKVENMILRSKLPRQVPITPRERQRLIRYAWPVGAAVIRYLASIVTPGTFYRWLNGHTWTKGNRRKLPGRPRTSAEREQLVLRIARETGWGYTRILGELKKLNIHSLSRSTVVNILKRNGLNTGPDRGKSTWDEFIRLHRPVSEAVLKRSPITTLFKLDWRRSLRALALEAAKSSMSKLACFQAFSRFWLVNS